MGESTADPPSFDALAGPLAAFHAAVFVAVPVLALHLVGGVGDLLATLSTTAGMGAYLLLWGLCWATARRWVGEFPARGWFGGDAGGHLLRAGVWGAVTGVGFLWVGLTAVLASQVDPASLGAVTPQFLLLVLSVGYGLGGAVAATVGSLVGTLLGTVDCAAFAVAARVAPRSGEAGGDRAGTTDPAEGSTE